MNSLSASLNETPLGVDALSKQLVSELSEVKHARQNQWKKRSRWGGKDWEK